MSRSDRCGWSHSIRQLSLAIASFLGAGAPCLGNASPITVEVTGVVVTVRNFGAGLGELFPVAPAPGTPYTYRFTYDPALSTDSNVDPTLGHFAGAITGQTVIFGAQTYQFPSLTSSAIDIQGRTLPAAWSSFGAFAAAPSSCNGFGTHTISGGINLSGGAVGYFPDDALPTAALQLSAFQGASFSFVVQDSHPATGCADALDNVTGSISSLTVGATGATNLSAEIPSVTQAPPISSFPAPANILTDVAPFVAAHGSGFSPEYRAYLQQRMQAFQDESASYHPLLSPATKALVNNGATVLDSTFGLMKTGVDIITSTAGAFAAKAANVLAFHLSAMASSVVSLPPLSANDPQGLTFAKRVVDMLGVACTAIACDVARSSGDVPLAVIMLNVDVWGDWVPSAMHAFAKDPVALDYQTPVPVILPSLPTVATGTPSSAFVNQFNIATLRSIAFLEAVNASFDRYTAAYQAGDNLAAATQLAAYLHYLQLFGGALGDAKSLFDQLPAILRDAGVVGGAGNAASLRSLQATLAASGMPSAFADYLLRNGLPANKLSVYFADITSFPFQSGPDVYTSIAAVQRALGSFFARQVGIDIKPGDSTNPINLRSSGVVPVAILSDATFDATQVDPASITFAGGSVGLLPKAAKYSCSKQDVNGDGRLDFVCQIPTMDLNLQASDTTALLAATTLSGSAIIGVDSVKVK